MAAKRKSCKRTTRRRRKSSGPKKAVIYQITGQVTLANTSYISEPLVIPQAQVLSQYKPGSAVGIEVLQVDVLRTTEEIGHAETLMSVGIRNWNGADDLPPAYVASKQNIWTWNSGATNATGSFDLTDDNGNGIIVPGDVLYFTCLNTGDDDPTWTAKIYYRIKNLPLTAYVNMVNQFLLA